MGFFLRLLAGYFLIVAIAAYFVFSTFLEEVKPGVRQTMEETLVDTANLLAELAGPELAAGLLREGEFAAAVQRYRERKPNAQIWDFNKSTVDLRVFVTDANGTVLYDSDGTEVGRDYSRWRDVYRTLRGQYGARSTRVAPDDDNTSIMHVAAPIYDRDILIGVLTVAKPTWSVLPYVQRSQQRITQAGLTLLGFALLIGIGFAVWLMLAVNRLRRYAKAVTEGERAVAPKLGSRELNDLSRALEAMRIELDGKEYVEHYVHTLTHEMKSPLAAIRGAAELLREDLPPEDRHRFVGNIGEQAERLTRLVNELLALAAVERRRELEHPAAIPVGPLLERVVAARAPTLTRRGIRCEVQAAPNAKVRGEAFLLEQAVGNVLDNAIDFSPAGATISITATVEQPSRNVVLQVRDHGPGIPDYAQERIFERFFSLPRPDTQRKSTGLGLPFVAEVVALHRGEVTVSNHPDGGVLAAFVLPPG